MTLGRVSLALSLLLAAGIGMARADEGTPRGVLELFTSQGCSSCPDADRLIARLARDPSLVVLSFPVPYWDYLGWKDTLAKPEFSERQRKYALRHNDKAVYTPQVIVNGRTPVIGSNAEDIERSLTELKADGRSPTIPVQLTADGEMVHAAIGAAQSPGRPLSVWLLQFDRSDPVQVGRGENSGRTLVYTHVVRQMQPIGVWQGQAMTIDLPAKDLLSDPNRGLAVFVQGEMDGGPGAVRGAAIFNGLASSP